MSLPGREGGGFAVRVQGAELVSIEITCKVTNYCKIVLNFADAMVPFLPPGTMLASGFGTLLMFLCLKHRCLGRGSGDKRAREKRVPLKVRPTSFSPFRRAEAGSAQVGTTGYKETPRG